MGIRVHVVKRQPEYAGGYFNWAGNHFKWFLDLMGCDTSGDEYAEDFDCSVDSYKKAVWALAIYVHSKKGSALYKKFHDFLINEAGCTVEDFEAALSDMSDAKSLQQAAKENLEDMVMLLVQRDKTSDYISFACF